MQNNLPATLSTKVHVKGANPKRYVVLSGRSRIAKWPEIFSCQWLGYIFGYTGCV